MKRKQSKPLRQRALLNMRRLEEYSLVPVICMLILANRFPSLMDLGTGQIELQKLRNVTD